MPDAPNRIVCEFLKYRDVLVRALLRLSVQPVDVDDILQESLTRALEADGKKRLEFPKSYLFAVSRNMVFREQERRSREVQVGIDEAILESNTASGDRELHYERMLEAFWEAMESLPKAHRRAILLRRIYGLSHKEIAGKMGVSLSSVEKYFAQGIRRCQEIMLSRGYGTHRAEGIATDTSRKRAGSHGRNLDGKDGSHD